MAHCDNDMFLLRITTHQIKSILTFSTIFFCMVIIITRQGLVSFERSYTNIQSRVWMNELNQFLTKDLIVHILFHKSILKATDLF